MNTNAHWIKQNQRRAGKLLLLATGLAITCGSLGCQALIGIAVVTGQASRQKVDAQYQLPEGPLVILIDDFHQVVQPPLANDVLLDTLIEELRNTGAIGSPITTREEIGRLRQVEPDFDKKTIREVGRMVGADTMIWIAPTSYTVQDNFDFAHSDGRFIVRLKVFDIHAEDSLHLRLWPDSRGGYEIMATLSAHIIRNSKSKQEVHRELGRLLAVEIAKLFHDHTIEREP